MAALLADGVPANQIVVIDTDQSVLDAANNDGLVTVKGTATKADVLKIAGRNLSRYRRRTMLTLLLIVIGIGLCAGLVSMLLPDKPPLCKAGTLPHWVFFGQQILRDLLRAVVVLAAAG